MKRQIWGLLGVLLLVAVLLFVASFASAMQPASRTTAPEWVTVFSDTFTTALPVWTISDETPGGASGYQWGVAPYTWESTPDQGFWAAGGGALGAEQEWATGSYTNGMSTLAIAGPFTLTRETLEVRLTAQVLDASASGDMLYLSLSRDGRTPIGSLDPVTISGSTWQPFTQSTGAFAAGEAVWVFILFQSDASGTAQGPLIDDLKVEARYRHEIYLPMLRLDPTPTPLPIFQDDFVDPTSGWYVGWAERFNVYTDRNGVYHEEWEKVAEMLYRNGTYQIQIPLTWQGYGDVDTWFVWPAEMAPLPASSYPLPQDYCIEVRGRIPKTWSAAPGEPLVSPYFAHWGIVFGANDTRSELYTFQINSRGNLGIVGFHNYIYPGDRDNRTPDNVEWPIYRWAGNDLSEFWSDGQYGSPAGEYTTLKVRVIGPHAEFFVNGQHLATAQIGGMPRGRVGLIGGSFEVTPLVIEFDSFRYDPFCTP